MVRSVPTDSEVSVDLGQGSALATVTPLLRGEGSNLQHPAPKADVLPIELPRKDPRAVLLVPASGP
jgi:hypothetical protein